MPPNERGRPPKADKLAQVDRAPHLQAKRANREGLIRTQRGSRAALRFLIFSIDNGFRPSLAEMKICVDLLRPLLKEPKRTGPGPRATVTTDHPKAGRYLLMAQRVKQTDFQRNKALDSL